MKPEIVNEGFKLAERSVKEGWLIVNDTPREIVFSPSTDIPILKDLYNEFEKGK